MYVSVLVIVEGNENEHLYPDLATNLQIYCTLSNYR